jgi:hypothetical protein
MDEMEGMDFMGEMDLVDGMDAANVLTLPIKSTNPTLVHKA